MTAVEAEAAAKAAAKKEKERAKKAAKKARQKANAAAAAAAAGATTTVHVDAAGVDDGGDSQATKPSEVGKHVTEADGALDSSAKKKKKKRKKKAGGGGSGDGGGAPKQTAPEPTIPIHELYPDGDFPSNPIWAYEDSPLWNKHEDSNLLRTTPAEMRAKEALMEEQIADLRQAAEVRLERSETSNAVASPLYFTPSPSPHNHISPIPFFDARCVIISVFDRPYTSQFLRSRFSDFSCTPRKYLGMSGSRHTARHGSGCKAGSSLAC